MLNGLLISPDGLFQVLQPTGAGVEVTQAIAQVNEDRRQVGGIGRGMLNGLPVGAYGFFQILKPTGAGLKIAQTEAQVRVVESQVGGVWGSALDGCCQVEERFKSAPFPRSVPAR
jgi:hypothetical protein